MEWRSFLAEVTLRKRSENSLQHLRRVLEIHQDFSPASTGNFTANILKELHSRFSLRADSFQ